MACAQAQLVQKTPDVNQACKIRDFVKNLAEFANSIASFKKT